MIGSEVNKMLCKAKSTAGITALCSVLPHVAHADVYVPSVGERLMQNGLSVAVWIGAVSAIAALSIAIAVLITRARRDKKQ